MHAQLFEVINEDYNDFVSLSTKLVNVEAAVAHFQAPLLDVQVASLLVDPCSLHLSTSRVAMSQFPDMQVAAGLPAKAQHLQALRSTPDEA